MNDQFKSASLVLKKNRIMLNLNNKNHPISASSVYDYVFKNEEVIDQKYIISENLVSGIQYSRYPIDLQLVISVNSEANSLILTLEGIQPELKIESDNFSDVEDHIILQNTWYPFVNGRLEEIFVFLKKLDIHSFGEISFAQYYSLKSLGDATPPFLLDQVNSDNLAEILPARALKDISPSFKGQLYDYQELGVRWLCTLTAEGLGGILGDEMGLGKTIQAIATICYDFQKGKPALIIAKATLLENWRREFQKFTYDFDVIIHHGPNRTGRPLDLKNYDVVITSYGTITRDISMFRMINWNIVFADEAQDIKNPAAIRTKAIKSLRRRSAFAITGTPIENKLLDIWSLYDFSLPGFLGDLSKFETSYSDNLMGAHQLEPVIKPFLLRRKIIDVVDSLPDRIDIPQYLNMDEVSAQDYEHLRVKTQQEYGGGASLVTLIKLRQFCCHKKIILGDDSFDPVYLSNKYLRTTEIIEEIVENREKVIIFSSFTKMLDLLSEDLRRRFDLFTDKIDGTVKVSERQKILDEFSDVNGPGILMLNPKAAGTGLNITAANHVIHYNPEWNPATEDQASSRAYRLGQEKPVTIHRLLYSKTVEELMDERLQRKRQLAEATVIGTEGVEEDMKDILKALSMTPYI